ncbi:Speedy protein E4 [Manis javanica]|nr:Speedy protein E4 [Manis javanica]
MLGAERPGPPGDLVVKRFLTWDKNLRVSDKYLLAMVIAYFSRAGLPSWQYQRIHFFVALYLANDMEEDYEGPKQAILWLLYGNNRAQRLFFHQWRLGPNNGFDEMLILGKSH